MAKKILLSILLLCASCVIHAQTSSEVEEALECATYLDFEKEMNAKAPTKIDETTELVQIRVNCDGKVITYTKRILVDASRFSDGWEVRKQRQHTQLHCNEAGLASQSGWIAMDIIYDKDFTYLLTFITRPENCDDSEGVSAAFSDKDFERVTKELTIIESRAQETHQGIALPLMNLIAEISDVAAGVVLGQITHEYAEEKQSRSLIRAYMLLEEFNESLERFLSLEVHEPLSQKFKRNYSNFLKNVSDELVAMIREAEEMIEASAEGNYDVLDQLWISSLDRSILMMKGENAAITIPQAALYEEHPQHSYLESAVQINLAVIEVTKTMKTLYFSESISSVNASLYGCKASLENAKEAVKKGRSDLLSYVNQMRQSVSEQHGQFSHENYLATFDNESIMISLLDEVCTTFFDLVNKANGEIDYEMIDQVWVEMGVKIGTTVDRRMRLQKSRTQAVIENL
jgi:hypothetical protein